MARYNKAPLIHAKPKAGYHGTPGGISRPIAGPSAPKHPSQRFAKKAAANQPAHVRMRSGMGTKPVRGY